jgi:hypothetical protein
MSTESASNPTTNGPSAGEEKKIEREMVGAIDNPLEVSRDVPFGVDPVTGIDVRNLGPDDKHIIPQYGEGKDPLAVYPAEGDDTDKLYVRTMKTGGLNSGRSVRAYIDKARTGARKGQYISVTTDYNSKDIPDYQRTKGSRTTVTVYGENDEVIREREHESNGVGLSPLVTKIVTKGIDAQIQKVKDSNKES